MCGILGLWRTDGPSLNRKIIQNAARLISHRGPDDEGFLWLDTRTGHWTQSNVELSPADFAFAFRRLSILDLSPTGNQPMSFDGGRYWIVFNGEIYNYIELRAELQSKGYSFRSESDTEVILAAYAAWGEGCLSRLSGMWAFALWDSSERTLFCARDRFGIKPFYYAWQDGNFAFASEIKSLLPLIGSSPSANPEIIYDFLANGWTDHTQETFFQNIYQLPAAHYLRLRDGQLTVRCYWALDPELRVELPSDSAYAEQFLALFTNAVRLHLRSDVTVGTCLSGGLDSSSIVHVANRLLIAEHTLPAHLTGQRQKTFSAAFEDSRFDERPYIDQVLAATGAESNLVFPSGKRLMEVLPDIIWHQDEPFGSTSLFAQWSVMERVAERRVKVLLDGQGADELLAGYPYYFYYFWGALAQSGKWSTLFQEVAAYHEKYELSLIHIILGIGKNFVPPCLVRWARRFRREGVNLGIAGLNPDFAQQFHQRFSAPYVWRGNRFEDYLHSSLMTYSLPALLRYEDRNSMAHSIEARVPFLDHRLVEFVFGLPVSQKIHKATTKVILRQAMQGILPEEVRQRRDKMGFVTPEKHWLNAELGELLNEIAFSPRFAQRGYLDAPQIRRMINQHRAGQRDISFIASRWLSLELWFRQFIDPPKAQGT